MKPIVRIEVETLPDKEGKQRFVTTWQSTQQLGRRRAQYFSTSLAEHIKYWQGLGYTVDVTYKGMLP